MVHCRWPVQPGPFGGMEQLEARLANNQEVAGSTPAPATNLGVAPDAWRFHQFPPGTRATPPEVPRVASAKGSRAPGNGGALLPRISQEVRGFFFPSLRGQTPAQKIFVPQPNMSEPVAKTEKKFNFSTCISEPMDLDSRTVGGFRLPQHGKKGDLDELDWICTPSRWDFCGLPGLGRRPC